MFNEKTFIFSLKNDASFVKQTNEILKLISRKQLISLEELKKEVGEINKNCSNLLSLTPFLTLSPH